MRAVECVDRGVLFAIVFIMGGFSMDVRVAAALDPDASSSDAAKPTVQAGGEELYNASCVVCHGPRATGGIGPRLAGNPVLKNDQAFQKIMSEGRHMMTPLADTLTEPQLAGIRAWLRTLR